MLGIYSTYTYRYSVGFDNIYVQDVRVTIVFKYAINIYMLMHMTYHVASNIWCISTIPGMECHSLHAR